MRPILFNKNETAFDTYGLGELNVTKGTATRERNGNYTLYAEIPVNDPMVSILQKEMKLKADAGLRTKNQTFEISRIVKDSSNIVKIYGQHISHKLEYMAIRNGLILNGTAFNALSLWRNALIGDYSFDVWSDIQTSATTTLNIDKVTNARLALGGVEGSILDIWGGEYEFDNMTVRLHKQLGRTAPTVLEYGRNILSAETDETIEDAYTSVLPFATYTPEKPEGDTSDSQPDPITVTIPENYVDSKYKALYAHHRIKVVDFSSEFNSDSKKKNIPNADKLRKLASDYMERNSIGKPKINTKIEYVDLAKTLDYADRAWIEELELCDIVPIYYPQIGLTDETAKVTTITYDFVNERNASVEFGEIGTNVRATMQSGLAGKVDEIAKAQQNLENSLPDYLLNAQGNKVWYNRPDENVEHKVGDIWFEKNGLYDRMYIWNGSMWEKRIDTEDVDKVKKEVDKQLEEANKLTAIEIEKANAKAQEALVKAGTIPDASKLSEQIKTLILNSPDLNQKVTETLNQTDSTVIYNKIYQNISQEFTSKQEGEYLVNRLGQTNKDLDDITSKISKQTVEFQKLTETNKLYERIIGTSETDAPDKVSRLVMSSEIFQTEVNNLVVSDNNLIVNSQTMDKNTVTGERPGVMITPQNGIFTIYARELTSFNWGGFTLPLYVPKILKGEVYTLGFKYKIMQKLDHEFCVTIKNHSQNKSVLLKIVANPETPVSTEWQEFQGTFTMVEDLEFDQVGNNPVFFYLVKNGYVQIKEPMLVRGPHTGSYKPSQFDDAYRSVEATRTQVTQLAGSWSVKNLSGAGDVLNSINLLANGTNRIDGSLTHITGQTKIDNAVIKDGMIANLNADKITGGTIDASKINVIHIDASQINAGVMQNMTMRGGRIESLNGRMNIDLQNGQINILDNGAGLTRQGTNLPTQILRMIDDTQITNTGKKYSTLTVLGSTRDKNALTHVSGFAGMRIYNRDETLTELVGDQIILYTNNTERSPWIFKAGTNKDHHRLIPSNDNGQKHSIGRSDKPLHELHVGEIYLNGVRLKMALKDMLNRMGYVGNERWGDRVN
nr:MAG TPA: tail protein [Caudoviricetes sp.]